jgi:cutinase
MMEVQHQATRSPRRFGVGKRWVAALAVTLGAGAATAAGLGVAQAGASTMRAAPAGGCPDVELAFSRGSTELPGLGIVGTPLLAELRADLPGKSVGSWANPYGASITQLTAGPGATDLSQHIISEAAACPNTQFVLGGYSQGASVIDISIGIPTLLGVGEHIPTSLASRIPAILTFGNPLKLFGQTIEGDSPNLWGPKNDNFCNLGDPVCANGLDILAHLQYGFNGDTNKAAAFAAQKING